MATVFKLEYVGSPAGLMEYLADQICEYCGGTGEIIFMERVYPGEPHEAFIGSKPCECQRK